MIKCEFGHVHDFHCYPYASSMGPGEPGWLKCIFHKIRGKCRSCLDYFGLSPEKSHEHLDLLLHIPPIEVEDPFSTVFKEESGKDFSKLEDILLPSIDDSRLAQLRVKSSSLGESKNCQRALLRLRGLFSQKKDRSLSYNSEDDE